MALDELVGEFMKLSRLKRHLETVYLNHVNYTVEILERRAKLYQAITLGAHGFQSIEKQKRQAA